MEDLSENTLPYPENIFRIRDYFRGRDVFITGGSGFMGKVLIEKLLWSCEDIGYIYVLLRAKRGLNSKQRLENMLSLEIFNRLKKRDKTALKKIIPISGNLLDDKLGLNEEDASVLKCNVSVVFHVAANIKFHEPLTRSILMNVRGTRDVVDLARCMTKLTAFVHVSTAYANSHKQYIDEELYTHGGNWRMFIKMAEMLDPTEINILEEKILGHQPNTYTFSKFLAENLVNDSKEDIPVVIFRPSVVLFCLKEPLVGWIDNFTGVIALWLAYLTGVLHVLLTNNTNKLDHIPCDLAINGLIMTACYRGNTNTKKCTVINAASGERNRLSYRYLFDIALEALNKYPPRKLLWYPSFFIVENYYLYVILSYILHVIPGMIFEVILKIRGINFSILMIYRKIYSMHKHVVFFPTNDFKIISRNYFSLRSYLHPDDKDEFPTDMHSFDDTESTFIAIKGFKKYLLNEKIDEASLEKARKNHMRMFYLHCIMKVTFILLLVYFIGYPFIMKPIYSYLN